MKIPENTKAVLFDLDGVIFNSEDSAHLVFESLSKKYGYVFLESDHKAVLGSSEEFWSNYMAGCLKNQLNAAEFASCFWTDLKKEAELNLQLMPGVRELFNALNSSGIQKCLVTSSPRDYVEETLTKFNLLSEFSFLVTGDDENKHKPSPEPYLDAVQRFGVDSRDCVVIEDSLNGVISGKSAGCYVVAVPTIHANGIDYWKADAVIKNLSEIIV